MNEEPIVIPKNKCFHKSTPDGEFTVYIVSESFDPNRGHELISGRSLIQLGVMLTELILLIKSFLVTEAPAENGPLIMPKNNGITH